MDMASHPAMANARVETLDQRARWSVLADAAAEANAFYIPDMLCAALDHLAGGATVRVLEAQRDGELIGLMPVAIAARHGRLPLRCVTNWMHDHCFFGAPLIRRGDEVAAWRELLGQLDRAAWAPAFLHLRGLDAAGANAAALEALCVEQRRGRREVHRHDRAMLRSELDADAYWETHVRAKKRKELRRLQKRLAEMGRVESRLLGDGAELAAWCGEFLALEAAGWKGAEGSALACRGEDAAFFRAACAAAFENGRLHFLRMDLDGRAIAMLVNFRHGEGAFSFKIAFDETLGRFSPGVLIEIANLQAVLGDPGMGWMDSCAAADHPMIDSLWAERRTIAQYRIALRGPGRSIAFALANGVEALGRRLKGQD
ncbi:GNAT family N-acetyltransferase [Sphingobium sp. R-21]|uniref:GNAT family N-acetyltransferase n=1 Tax=Sphingobium sp. R-21 TaxID=3404056 RepID=UPI003CF7120D